MTKADLINKLCSANPKLSAKDVTLGVNVIIKGMVKALTKKKRIEIRGFGSFSIRERRPRIARNPKTGDKVSLPKTFASHFKPGVELRDAVNQSILVG